MKAWLSAAITWSGQDVVFTIQIFLGHFIDLREPDRFNADVETLTIASNA
ncbi:MAG: hypothetical protein AAGD09_25860 [Cyanobacteria bacterium P01_F01_bin.56]